MLWKETYINMIAQKLNEIQRARLTHLSRVEDAAGSHSRTPLQSQPLRQPQQDPQIHSTLEEQTKQAQARQRLSGVSQQTSREQQQQEQQLELEQQQQNALQQEKIHQQLSGFAEKERGMQLHNAVEPFRGTSWHN